MSRSQAAARHSASSPATTPASPRRVRRLSRLRRVKRLALVAGASTIASIGMAAPAIAQATPHAATPSSPSYAFRTVDNMNDPTFNQLLGINNSGMIAGYFGSGAQGHPNKGYITGTMAPIDFANENFPGSVQTQVTGLNNNGVTVGFFSTQNNANLVNDNFGFVSEQGTFRKVDFPTGTPAAPPVDQLLGVNDHNVAVGFYTDAEGNNHGYTYDVAKNRYARVRIPGASSVTAAAINNRGDIAGFDTDPNGDVVGFLRTTSGVVTTLAYPGASMTQAFGVNDEREVVGTYTVGSGDTAMTFGFTWTARHGFSTLSDPDGVGTTTVNGVNDAGDIVGFYVDGAGNTDGMIATPMPTAAP